MTSAVSWAAEGSALRYIGCEPGPTAGQALLRKQQLLIQQICYVKRGGVSRKKINKKQLVTQRVKPPGVGGFQALYELVT